MRRHNVLVAKGVQLYTLFNEWFSVITEEAKKSDSNVINEYNMDFYREWLGIKMDLNDVAKDAACCRQPKV